ncbi:excisionase family DNA-binding protein [Neobacillus kokaensis]|uniref:Helix-turn-helix domain-containing protein n=1 Tax=Neobacillus kokaensis TaxID=2759023 RepID=A0ABQ3MY24_9BACI|nr:excisionase family DNA-binding protein [Neobacillus kokaensis]GHH96658.1 helix-turn-helix domain-containing protein [Neobacillus kokaensis]
MERQTLSAKEAAKYIGISYWLILDITKRKEIPCIRVGSRVLFRKDALDDWMEEKEHESVQQPKMKLVSTR